MKSLATVSVYKTETRECLKDKIKTVENKVHFSNIVNVGENRRFFNTNHLKDEVDFVCVRCFVLFVFSLIKSSSIHTPFWLHNLLPG